MANQEMVEKGLITFDLGSDVAETLVDGGVKLEDIEAVIVR
jgi:hypothetical protein